MPQFRTVAIDGAGRTVRGTVDAPDQQAAIERLRRDGSLPVSAVPDRGGSGGWLRMDLGGGGAGMRRTEVADWTRELATMLGAGQDLDRALRFLAETAPGARVRGVVERLRDRVRNGGTLHAALDAVGGFTPLYVGLVRAGEAGGNLAPTLDRLAVLLERERSLRATVTSALIYPAVLLLAAVGSVVLLLTTVLPQFVPLFEANGAALPASTRFVIGLGTAVSDYGLAALLLLLAAGLAARTALRRPGPRLLADRALLRLPVAGGLAREILAARLTRTLGTLLGNGVPLIAALGIVRGVLGNAAGARALDDATASARNGAGLSGPLAASGVLPARTIHLLRLGEETAQLGPMALRAAEIHEEAARLGTGRLVALLTPAITVVMGAVIAGIISSLLLAMLSLNDLAG